MRRKHKPWTKARVVQEIRARRRARRPLNHDAVMKTASRLRAHACGFFGSWDGALIAAGVDPSLTRKPVGQKRGWRNPSRGRRRGPRINWTKKMVLHGIRARHRAGRSLNAAAVHADDGRSLYKFARRICGSWDRALAAASIDIRTARKCRRWTKADILREIASRRRARLPLNAGAVMRDWQQLYTFARRRFGSWDHALFAAGVDVAATRKRRLRPSGGATARRPLMIARR